MSQRFLLLPLLAVALTLTGCDMLGSSDDDSTRVTSGVYVANAGAFGEQNSTLSIYAPSTGQTQHLPRDEQGFASYIQSIAVDGSSVYVLFGETNSIGIIDAEQAEQVDQISGVRNPRYMTVVENTGYVTGQDYRASPSPKLYQVDLSTQEVVDSVEVGGSPEGVAAVNDRVFVALGGQDGALAVVDPASMSVTETVAAECDAPRSLAVDGQEELLVFCAGSTIYNDNFEVVDRTNGAIRVINPATTEITTRIPLDTMLTSISQGQRVHYAPETDEAFAVLAGGTILRFNAAANAVADQFEASGAPIGAIGYDGLRERLYLGRAASPTDIFTAEGSVSIHRPSGEQVDEFAAGIAPTHIDFRRTEE